MLRPDQSSTWARTARWLGVISYGVYLMHGIVLQSVMRNLAAHAPFQSLSAMVFWEFAILAAALTVVLSAITYQCVEKPLRASSKMA